MTTPQPIKLGAPVTGLKPVKLGTPVTPIKIAPVGVAAPVTQPVQATPIPPAADPKDDTFNALFPSSQVDLDEEEEEEDDEVPSQEERTAEIKGAVDKVKNGKKKGSATEKAPKKYEGPREVKVYGNTIFIEENPNVTLEQIRERIVEEYHYKEFSKESTEMVLIEEAGIVVPQTKFQKKG